MITLGTFTKRGNAFQGSILRRDFAGSIDIVPVGDRMAVAGMYRVYAEGAPIGSAWQARDARGRGTCTCASSGSAKPARSPAA